MFADRSVRIVSDGYIGKSSKGLATINNKEIRISANDFYPICLTEQDRLAIENVKEYPPETPFMVWLKKLKICEDIVTDTFYIDRGKDIERILREQLPDLQTATPEKWVFRDCFWGRVDAYKNEQIYEIKSVCKTKLSGYFNNEGDWTLNYRNNMPFTLDPTLNKASKWLETWTAGDNAGKNKALYFSEKYSSVLMHKYIWQVCLYLWIERKQMGKMIVGIYGLNEWDGKVLNFIPNNNNTLIFQINQMADIEAKVAYCKQWYEKYICTGISPPLTKGDLIWLEKQINNK